jgi:hypothetical protein
MKKIYTLAFAASLANSAAFGQVVRIESANGGPRGGQDPSKIVCEVESRTGTRLDTRKVCMTLLEWERLRRDHREGIEAIQRNGTSVGCQEGQSCGG